MMKFPFLYLIIIFLFVSCSENSSEKDVQLYAASSLNILDSDFNQLASTLDITLLSNYTSSGIIARQISNGATSDIFISANISWINYLKENNKLDTNSIFRLLKNKLVVVKRKGKVLADNSFTKDSVFNFTNINRIAIGDPDFVPVGNYAKQFLNYIEAFDLLKGKSIMAKDAVSALHYAEIGECDLAIVYLSDALRSEKVEVVYRIPEHMHENIYYYIALTKNANKLSRRFYNKLISTSSNKIFINNGFDR